MALAALHITFGGFAFAALRDYKLLLTVGGDAKPFVTRRLKLPKMTERKMLKNKLSKLKHFKSNLPRLIDCSDVYGDGYYSKDDLIDVDKQINEVECQIADIDAKAELNGG